MIKRYNIVEHSYGDGDTSMDVREDLEGQYVEYEDIKQLLKNTSSNSDYAAAVKNLINSEVDCVQTKNGAYVNLDGVIDCLNRALHNFA